MSPKLRHGYNAHGSHFHSLGMFYGYFLHRAVFNGKNLNVSGVCNGDLLVVRAEYRTGDLCVQVVIVFDGLRYVKSRIRKKVLHQSLDIRVRILEIKGVILLQLCKNRVNSCVSGHRRIDTGGYGKHLPPSSGSLLSQSDLISAHFGCYNFRIEVKIVAELFISRFGTIHDS